MKKAKFGMVGCGFIAAHHIGACRQLNKYQPEDSNFDFVAVCDMSKERAKAFGEKYHVPYYTDMEEMLKKEKNLDVIDICTSHWSHHTLGKIAAENGKHVVVEKPIAMTLPCADLLIKACEKAGVIFDVAENRYRMPFGRINTKIIQSGLLGDVWKIYASCLGGPSYKIMWYNYDPSSWYYQLGLAGGGSLIFSNGIHIMNLIRAYAGFTEAKSVVGVTKNVMQPEISVENWGAAIMEFANGCTVIYEGGDARGVGEADRTLIIGTKGTIFQAGASVRGAAELHLYNSKDGKVVETPIERKTRKIDDVDVLEKYVVKSEPEVIWENPYKNTAAGKVDGIELSMSFADELSNMADAVLYGKELEYGGIQGRKDLELMEAIYESNLEGMKPVKIPITSPTAYERKVHEAYEKKFGHSPLKI